MDDKKYSAEYAAKLVLNKAYDVLKKAEDGSMSVKEAVDKILHDKWEVQDVLPKVAKDKQDEVLAKLRELKEKDYPHKSVHGYDKGDKKLDKSEGSKLKSFVEKVAKKNEGSNG